MKFLLISKLLDPDPPGLAFKNPPKKTYPKNPPKKNEKPT